MGIKWHGYFTQLQFAIRADKAFNKTIELYWGTSAASPYPLDVTTSWQLYTLNLATDLNSPSSLGDGPNPLTFKNTAGTTSPTIYLADMYFLPRNNASFVNKAYPPSQSTSGSGADTTTGGASGLQRIPILFLAFIAILCLCALLYL